MKKKIFAMMMALLLVVLHLVACTNNEKEIETAGITTVSVWSTSSSSKAFYDKLIAEFNETIGKEKGIKIDYQIKADLANQIKLALENDVAPDIMLDLVDLQKNVENGKVIALDDLPGGPEIIKEYSEVRGIKLSSGFDDKTYRVPWCSNVNGLVYNKDMFKAAGIVDENGEAKPPKTYAEVVEYAKILTNKEKGEYGIIFPAGWGAGWITTDWTPMMRSSSGSNSGYDPVKGEYDFSSIKPIADMYMQIKKDGSCMPGSDTMDNDSARARFADGKIGMKFAVSWDVGVFTDQFPAKCDWDVVPYPTENADEKYYQAQGFGWFGCVNAKSVKEKGADKIMEVYKWFISDEISKKAFEGGYMLPTHAKVSEGANLTNAPKGWEGFNNVLKICKPAPWNMPYDLNGKTDIWQKIYDDVWSQKRSIDEVIAEYNVLANEGIKRYQEFHPEFDPKDRIVDSSYNIRRED